MATHAIGKTCRDGIAFSCKSTNGSRGLSGPCFRQMPLRRSGREAISYHE